MRLSSLVATGLAVVGALFFTEAQAQSSTRAAGARKAANGYHRTSNTRTRARAGAYSRYDRSNRRDEENLKLAPGLRLNMPSPPTTDYMGRPLKKKAPKPAVTGASSISSEKTVRPTAPAARPTRRRQ